MHDTINHDHTEEEQMNLIDQPLENVRVDDYKSPTAILPKIEENEQGMVIDPSLPTLKPFLSPRIRSDWEKATLNDRKYYNQSPVARH